MEAVQGSVEDRAMMAFDTLIRTIQYSSGYDSVIFEDGTIGKCVEAMGGWETVNNWCVEDRKWNRMEFVKLYKMFEAGGPWPPVKFAGQFELDNTAKGYLDYIPEPIRIGSGDKRLKAIQGEKE